MIVEIEDKVDFEAMATDTLELSDDSSDIKISVCGHLEKGGSLTKHTVFLVRGEDKDGQFETYRREVMIQRWPGCFIPAVPDKKMIGKNDQLITMNRQRFLDNFVKKISSFLHLYHSQQFQLFIRSKQDNISSTIQKLSKPSYSEIITRYQHYFGELAGRQIDSSTTVKINNFTTFLKTSQSFLTGYKDTAKKLALSRSALDKKLANIFTTSLPNYQSACLSEYINTNPQKMIYGNPEHAKLQEHGQITQNVCSKNPYWLIYDLIKMQHRDGQALLQAFDYVKALQTKRDSMQAKTKQNQKDISNISQGNSSIKTIFSKGSKQQIKNKLSSQNEQLARQKQNLTTLCDIISALISYITIDNYINTKRKYYYKVLKSLSCYQINFIQNMSDIWDTCFKLTGKIIEEQKQEHSKSKKKNKKVEEQEQTTTNNNDE